MKKYYINFPSLQKRSTELSKINSFAHKVARQLKMKGFKTNVWSIAMKSAFLIKKLISEGLFVRGNVQEVTFIKTNGEKVIRTGVNFFFRKTAKNGGSFEQTLIAFTKIDENGKEAGLRSFRVWQLLEEDFQPVHEVKKEEAASAEVPADFSSVKVSVFSTAAKLDIHLSGHKRRMNEIDILSNSLKI